MKLQHVKNTLPHPGQEVIVFSADMSEHAFAEMYKDPLHLNVYLWHIVYKDSQSAGMNSSGRINLSRFPLWISLDMIQEYFAGTKKNIPEITNRYELIYI